MQIPVTVVTGFLGAGKTTLVNRWLAGRSRGEIAVIVNEHGDVGIDGELLAERARELVEITGGCVCCTTQAELVRALDDLASSKQPLQRILVETSGAASPAGVLQAIARGGRSGAFALDGVITVVDATRVEQLADHDLVFEQVGYADIVLLSRADACAPERLAEAGAFVATRNGAAFFAEAARGEVVAPAAPSLDSLLDLRRADFAASREAPARSASHVYESISLTLDGEVDGERFADFVETDLAQVAGRLFRTKGILAVTGVDERMIVQGVADSVEVTFGQPWLDAPRTSRLVIVGFGLDRAALTRGFAACDAARRPQ
ncbi:Putative metal chaperone, involved in Zn homeostasis [Labilithrix luteola]|uniref:Putative metal chaperone, involved in Zn homeostasis n=1 Tax=Labilithrix luteola TaxID=1391654 RepID=A0A0K1QA60_9BACT|nr:Putative metal chaperone, involved in Zn homeostasis [Labilithrix luteola]